MDRFPRLLQIFEKQKDMRKHQVIIAGLLLAATAIFVPDNFKQTGGKRKAEVEGPYAQACQGSVPFPRNYAPEP